MNIWTSNQWKKIYINSGVRKGMHLKCDRDVNIEVKRACKDFCKWLRTKYCFPIRIPIYLKSCSKIKAMDGDMVYATFFEPDNMLVEPYIRIATGYFDEF